MGSPNEAVSQANLRALLERITPRHLDMIERLDGRMRGLDMVTRNADREVVGADIGSKRNAAGQFILNPANSTMLPIVAKALPGAKLNADIFSFDDLIDPAGTVTLTASAVGTAGSDTITPAQFAAAGPVVANVAPSWLASDYDEYKVDLCYLFTNPSKLEGANVNTSEAASNAPMANALQLEYVTDNAFGRTDRNKVVGATFQYADQFQGNKATISLDFPIDLLHHMVMTTNIVNPSDEDTVFFTFAFSFSKRVEAFRKIYKLAPGGNGGASPDLNPLAVAASRQLGGNF